MIMTDTSTEASTYPSSPRVPDASAYHNERRRYLARSRRNPGLRQRYLRNLAGYLLLRSAWSFGFFPVILALWVPLVMAEFNPVVMVQAPLPHPEAVVPAKAQNRSPAWSKPLGGRGSRAECAVS